MLTLPQPIESYARQLPASELGPCWQGICWRRRCGLQNLLERLPEHSMELAYAWSRVAVAVLPAGSQLAGIFGAASV